MIFCNVPPTIDVFTNYIAVYTIPDPIDDELLFPLFMGSGQKFGHCMGEISHEIDRARIREFIP